MMKLYRPPLVSELFAEIYSRSRRDAQADEPSHHRNIFSVSRLSPLTQSHRRGCSAPRVLGSPGLGLPEGVVAAAMLRLYSREFCKKTFPQCTWGEERQGGMGGWGKEEGWGEEGDEETTQEDRRGGGEEDEEARRQLFTGFTHLHERVHSFTTNISPLWSMNPSRLLRLLVNDVEVLHTPDI